MALTVRRFRILLALVTAALAGTAAYVLPASSDPPMTTAEAIAAARAAFPPVAATVAGSPPVPATLPTRDEDASVVGLGSVTVAELTATLTLTDDAETCLTIDDASTCQPSEDTAQHGIYLARVTCSPAGTTVYGVVPDGVTEISALGAQEPATAEAGPDGDVTLAFAGDELHGLELDNDQIAPLDFESNCDLPAGP
jgi:hypothetical protein